MSTNVRLQEWTWGDWLATIVLVAVIGFLLGYSVVASGLIQTVNVIGATTGLLVGLPVAYVALIWTIRKFF